MTACLHRITVRPEQAQDEAFLFELYASTRQAELDAWAWPAAMRQSFLAMQFKASQSSRASYPDAEYQIIRLDDTNIGRMIVHRTQDALHVVDIALLPQYRNSGVGSALLRRILGEAAAAQKPVRLQVLKGNRAASLYRRLGFVVTGESGLHLEMEWHAAPVSARR